jgi:radical SAM superfamily enzyme YgiQ (UPF0313 family)
MNDRCNVLLIYPRFNAASFWNYRAACDLVGARHPAPPLGLITVAALLPSSWSVRLIDRNAEELAEADLAWADLVMTGGMLFQQPDTLRIIEMCRARGIAVACGGPDVTSTPSIYGGANFRVLGEAESIMADFVAAWRSGVRSATFEAQMGQTDVTKSPVPRFELLKLKYYLHVGIQFSRGCPFNCEFCDIIELYGRVPRSKTNQQILAELDALYSLGYRGHVDFVDDNLIGNKKALRRLLPDLQAWLRARSYPFEFSTEASINLSDDAVLMRDLVAANFFAVFVGIESPDTETLVLARKKQNTRRSLQDSIYRMYDAGLFVFAGFIVGFDTEGPRSAGAMVACIEDAAIPVSIIGLLYALPTTQLARRLFAEGRLFPGGDEACPADMGEQCTAGLNFVTKRPRVDVLTDYKTVLSAVYTPSAYFGRVRRMTRRLRSDRKYKPSLRIVLRDARAITRLIWRMPSAAPGARRHFFQALLSCALHNPRALPALFMLGALYLHHGPFSRHVIAQIERQIEAVETGAWVAPEPLPVPEAHEIRAA